MSRKVPTPRSDLRLWTWLFMGHLAPCSLKEPNPVTVVPLDQECDSTLVSALFCFVFLFTPFLVHRNPNFALTWLCLSFLFKYFFLLLDIWRRDVLCIWSRWDIPTCLKFPQLSENPHLSSSFFWFSPSFLLTFIFVFEGLSSFA